MKIPLLGQTGTEFSDDVSYQMTQNWYPHISTDGKSDLVLYPTPGLTSYETVGSGLIRGSIRYGDQLYVVNNDKLYQVLEGGGTVTLGTLSTTAGRVTMAHNGSRNGKQIILVDGTQGYIYDATYGTFAIIEQKSTGTADKNTLNKLDTSTAGGTDATFITDGVVAGMTVYNTTDGTQGIVGAVDSEQVLSIVNSSGTALDLFPDGNETYEVGDSTFPSTATHVVFFDGRFVANDPSNSGRFYASALYQGYDWQGLDYATVERSPDELSAIVVSGRTLVMVGTDTTELWYNTGSADFPFGPMQSGFIQMGTVASRSVIDISGTVLFLTRNDNGAGQVVKLTGTSLNVVSTPNIASMISDLTNIESAYAWSYQHNQHTFYVLTFPDDELTLVYDLSTNQWHQWSTLSLGYHNSVSHTYVYGKHMVGSTTSNNMFFLDWNNYTDNDEAIHRIRRSKHIHGNGAAIRHNAVQIDIEEGVGDATTDDPQISLRWRDDDGGWSSYYWRSMGGTGENAKRVMWRRLGRTFGRVYEIKVTDPVKAVLVDSYALVDADSRELG